MPFVLLSDAVQRICGADKTLTKLMVTKNCVYELDGYKYPKYTENDDDDQQKRHEKTNMRILSFEKRGEMEWYECLGSLIGSHGVDGGVRHILFQSLDPDMPELANFWFGILGWHEIDPNTSLRTVQCVDMDLRSPGNFLLWFQFERVNKITFRSCRIGSNIGHELANVYLDIEEEIVQYNHEEMSDIDREIIFDQSEFDTIKDEESITEFGSGLAKIRGLKTITFRNCLFKNNKTRRLIESKMEEDLREVEVRLHFVL